MLQCYHEIKVQKFAKASLNHRVTLQAQPDERVLGKIRQNESLKQYCCLASAGNEGGLLRQFMVTERVEA